MMSRIATLSVFAGLILALLGMLVAVPRQQSAAAPHRVAPAEFVARSSELALPEPAPQVDAARMQRHTAVLAGEIGVRKAGTPGEAAAADYIAQQLVGWGYDVHRVSVPLPDGRISTNVYAELPGASDRAVLIGAHLDSKSPAPGANDNASGVAVVLELARLLRQQRPPQSVIFAAFGAEERVDRVRDHHHYGSRLLAADPQVRDRLSGMVAVDMVGVGDTFYIDHQGWASPVWRDRLSTTAKTMGLPVRCGVSKPWSDHEAFERRGIPTAYLHWERDTAYHTRNDRPERINPTRLRQTAEVLRQGVMDAGSM